MRRLIPLLALLLLAAPAGGAESGGATVLALVTAETENQLIVALPTGRVLKRLHVPADPENVDARLGGRTAVVVSTRGAAVSLIATRSLRVAHIIRGFRNPHIPAITPDGRYAYVTDDGNGKLSVISLGRRRLVRRVFVGLGAHHMAVRPDGRRTWVALGEHARSIVILDTSRPTRPRVIGRVDPHGAGHDLAFTPSGARVWVTHSDSDRVAVFDARTHRLMKTFEGGPPPQHVAFMHGLHGPVGLVTSGYAGTLQIHDARTGRLLHTLRTGYGSFNLGIAEGIGVFATSSLLRGTLTTFNLGGRKLIGRAHLAPAARDVALTN